MNGSNVTYCDLKNFKNAFLVYYHYLSLIICLFGSVTNVLNICVLTRKQLRSPTNLILTGLALANLLLMLEDITYVFLVSRNNNHISHFTYNLSVYVIFHAFFAQSFHYISCCLTVILAVWQYIAVKFPQNNNKWCSNRRTIITIFLTYAACLCVCFPLYYYCLEIVVHEYPVDEKGYILPKEKPGVANVSLYVTDYKSEYHQHLSSYVYAIWMKMVPCVLLTLLSSLLIVELLKAKERRKNLMNPKNAENTQIRKPSQRFLDKEKQSDRTTRMLLAVLLLFLMVEFPQAIFGLLNVIIGKQFEIQCYQKLGDVVDLLTLTNSSINFILYCIMSKKFRQVFKETFFSYLPCSNPSKKNWLSLQTIQTYV